MKIEKLPRDFVYTDRRTLDDFLRSDDLNKELYKVTTVPLKWTKRSLK